MTYVMKKATDSDAEINFQNTIVVNKIAFHKITKFMLTKQNIYDIMYNII